MSCISVLMIRAMYFGRKKPLSDFPWTPEAANLAELFELRGPILPAEVAWELDLKRSELEPVLEKLLKHGVLEETPAGSGFYGPKTLLTFEEAKDRYLRGEFVVCDECREHLDKVLDGSPESNGFLERLGHVSRNPRREVLEEVEKTTSEELTKSISRLFQQDRLRLRRGEDGEYKVEAMDGDALAFLQEWLTRWGRQS